VTTLTADFDTALKHGHLSEVWGVLGNFFGKLPSGHIRFRASSCLDTKYPDPKMNKTYGELFEDVDEAIDELGISMDIIEALQQDYGDFPNNDTYARLSRMSIPVFVRLVDIGYSPENLQG